MADPTTELAKEFLEVYGYSIRKVTKFTKNRKLKGTPGDIDIIAVSPKNVKFREFELKKEIVAEVKNWEVMIKDTFDGIYDNKFKYINDYDISWQQLRYYIKSKKFDRILFCYATTDKVYSYALKKRIRIITAGFMIKELIKFYKNQKKSSFYPEWYNLNLIRSIMDYLVHSYKYHNKLVLEDLVWIDPEKDTQYRNKFNKLNGKLMADFLYYDNENLIDMIKDDPDWFFDESLKKFKKSKKQIIIKKVERYFKNS